MSDIAHAVARELDLFSDSVESTSRGEAAVSVGWADTGTGGRTLHRIAPPFVRDGGHFLRPGLGANADPVSPLMAWWIVSLALEEARSRSGLRR
jgi:hypothetical protein